jgi:hypothetical protein
MHKVMNLMKSKRIRYFSIILIFLLTACTTGRLKWGNIPIGTSLGEVRKQLGDPDRQQDFSLPEVPFWGPQEKLAGLIPPGTIIEEWVYVKGDKEFYIWFVGEDEQSKDLWKVIETGKAPVDAVY